MPVHNHGPEDGAGLACRETVISGRLVGACLLPLAEANRTLARLVELAPKVAPDVSGHDGFYFTHGYDTAEERAAAAEALSLVAHRYRVHEIPRDLCEELIACSHKLRNLATAPTLPEPRPDDEGRETVPDVIRRAADELARLCAGPGRLTHHRLAGRNWTMCVPVHHSDSDVIFGDLIEAAAKWHLASVTPHPAPLGATDEGRRDLPNSMWPVVVLQDRYSGSYAGGEWIAVSNGDDPARLQAVWDGAHGSDGHAMEFWGAHEPRPWLAVGDSPSAAVAALRAALQAGG